MIEVSNLVKRYGSHLAVDHLSFQVEEGQVYGFLGPNGAGKTTTMNMITGYLGATEGYIKVNGFDIFEAPEQAKANIGYLPELPPLYMEMTPYEYLKFAAELKKIKKAERDKMIDEVMEITGIQSVSRRLIKNLSKGYQQRVGLAQAILGYPKVIILDEPTVGLDPKQIIEIRDLIKRLSKEHTVILSSHILSEVSAICDKILIVSAGKLVACDTPEALRHKMTKSGSITLKMKVQGEKAKIEGQLAEIMGVKKAEFQKEDAEGLWDLVLEVSDELEVRAELFYKFAENRCPIYEIEADRVSLEEVFLELTEQEEESIDACNL